MIRNAQEELSQNYEKAKADRAAALRKANKTASAAAEQARVAAEEAQTLRKNMAAQAQIDRYSNCQKWQRPELQVHWLVPCAQSIFCVTKRICA